MFNAILKKQELATELRQKGFALSENGIYQEALKAHTQARKLNEELGDIGAAAGDVTNMAVLYEQIGDSKKAEEYHLEAAKMDESINYNQGLRIDYSNLARFYAQEGKFEMALEFQSKLIKTNLALGDTIGVAANYRDRGLLLSHLGRFDEALSCHNQARELNHLASNYASEAANITDIGLVYERSGQKDKAIEFYYEALKINESTQNSEGLRTDYRNLARLYAEKGDLVKAREYQTLLSKAIAETMDIPQAKVFSMDATGIKGAVRILKNQADTYDVGYDIPSPIRSRNRDYQVIINDRRLDEIKQKIDFVTEEINKAKKLRGVGVPSSSNELKKLNSSVFAELTNLGKALYAVTLPPQVKKIYRQILSTDAIEIGISENLVEYPWELMHNGGEFICLSNSIGRYVVVDDEEVLPNIRKEDRKRLRVLIVGDPCGSGEKKYEPPFDYLQDLPGARAEAQILAEFLQAIEGVEVKLFVGDDLDTVRFLSELSSDYDFIHFTGHAVFSNLDPYQSGLLLHDGMVPAYEILQCIASQQQPPALVFVNACESGKEIDWSTQTYYTNQVFGLASAFLKGGVNYLGAIWPLHDAPAIEIALQFYREIFNGVNFGEALRRARKYSIEKYGQSEIAWASYTYYGDPTTLLKSSIKDPSLLNRLIENIVSQRLFGLER